jgi:neopullulanase
MKLLQILLLLAAFTATQLFAQKSPQRVEPPFWWAGMHHAELQIMVYEPNIGTARVKIDHPGIIVKEVVAVENPNYLFIYLDLSEASPGTFQIEFISMGWTQYVYDFELKERDENARYREGFDAADAIYLLMPDRFANGIPENDNMPGMLEEADIDNPDGRHGGDIQGIIKNLDYIKNLGFTAIWINPLFENNQPRYSYHGYAITDFYKIDPRFGTNQDYLRLVKEAENKGLKIIKDMVFNHCGHKHWWMDDLPILDWINQWPEFTRTSYRMTTLVDPHFAQTDYDIMLKGWFDTNMPDLNQRNRLLATYLIQNSVWWIEYADIHGIRMDTQPFAELDFMADWGRYVAAEYPYFRIVGEAWMGIPAMVSYYQSGKINDDGYNSHIPSLFDFPLYDAVRDAFNEEPGWNTGVMRLYNMLAQDYLYPDPYNLVIFTDNHDITRIFTSLGEDVDKLKMALTFIFTTRGIPMMYYGTELLMTGYEHLGHGLKRKRVPGGWPGDEQNAFTARGRTDDQNEVVNHIRTLLEFRNAKPALHYGWLKHFVPQDNIYVYFRYNDESIIMVVINSNPQSKSLDTKRFAEVTSSFSSGWDLISGKTFDLDEIWIIPGKSTMVLDLR